MKERRPRKPAADAPPDAQPRCTIAQFAARLEELNACEGAIEWVLTERDPRADWLLWIAVRAGASHSSLRLVTCACARVGLGAVPDGEDRPLRAIEVAERYARGQATERELADARDAAMAAARDAARDAVVDSNWFAEWHAVRAAAIDAVWAAALDAVWGARRAASSETGIGITAAFVREHISYEDLHL